MRATHVTSPAVSIVVPVYNPGAFLGPLLASLLDQTEPSLEIVAVDDGSTDGSGDLLREAAARDPRLVHVSRANGGYAAARNSGIDAARGRWIGFADSDDWLDPRTLQAWREHGERHDLEVVLGNGFRFRGAATDAIAHTDELVMKSRPPPGVFTGAEWMTHAVAQRSWLHFVWLQLIRRDVLVRGALRFNEGIVHEDVLWTLELGLCTQRMGYLDTPLYGYRIHGASFTHNRTVEMLGKRAASYLVIIRRLLDEADARPDDRPLQRALRRHAQRESYSFFWLIEHGALPDDMRRALVLEFQRQGFLPAMFQGVRGIVNGLRAVRCWTQLQRCARF